MLNGDGGIETDLTVVCVDKNHFRIISSAATRERDKFHINKHLSNNSELKESEFLLYSSESGDIKVDVYFRDENIWLTQKKMSELFDTSADNVGNINIGFIKTKLIRYEITIKKFFIYLQD